MNRYFSFTPAVTQYSLRAQAQCYSSVAPVAAAQTYVQPAVATQCYVQPTKVSYSSVAPISAHATYQAIQQPTTVYTTYTNSIAPTATVVNQSFPTFYHSVSTQPATYTYNTVHPVAVTKQESTDTYIMTHPTAYKNIAQVPVSRGEYHQGAVAPSVYTSALYSAATLFNQKNHQQLSTTLKKINHELPGAHMQKINNIKRRPFVQRRPFGDQTQHYCEVCKISCVGTQTYKEHIEGQKHKKKEMAVKKTCDYRSSQRQLRCELCDITCSGVEAYTAHIRGSKHQKTIKLHQRLGKTIPCADPIVLEKTKVSASNSKQQAIFATAKKALSTTTTTVANEAMIYCPTVRDEVIKAEERSTVANAGSTAIFDRGDHVDLTTLSDNQGSPVGFEYIKEKCNEFGKAFQFNCTLCDCLFTDPNAKEMHLKGRRHRLQYKKKVNPSLEVEIKPSTRARKIQEDRSRHQRSDFVHRLSNLEERRHELQALEWTNYAGQHLMDSHGRTSISRRKMQTVDDRYVMVKHASIYPTDTELRTIQRLVTACEKALKSVSDEIAEEDENAAKSLCQLSDMNNSAEDAQISPQRLIKGVLRVGVLAKGLLLHGDSQVELVLLCSEKPTVALLERVFNRIPHALATVTANAPGVEAVAKDSEEQFVTTMLPHQACLMVSNTGDLVASCKITLTSSIVRELQVESGAMIGRMEKEVETEDFLNNALCLKALALMRHTKWFQAKASGLQACVVIIRILRDLCQRVSTWSPLSQWAMELLVEKCIASNGSAMNPGDALRRVFECVASGILLTSGSGLQDPCENDLTDAVAALSSQEREDITASAQHALRLIAFRQIHRVLDMEPLQAPFRTERTLKRRVNEDESTAQRNGFAKKQPPLPATTAATAASS